MAGINFERPTVDSTTFIVKAMRRIKQRLQIELEDLNKYKTPKNSEHKAEEEAYVKGAKDEVVKFLSFIEDMGV